MVLAGGSALVGLGVDMRQVRLGSLLGGAGVRGFGLARYGAFFFEGEGVDRLAYADGSLLAIEVWVQGALAGAGTVYTYAKAVQILGAARAAIFPALIPGLATLMGWPVLGHIPTLTEAIGLTLAIVGLLVTVTQGVPPDSRSSQNVTFRNGES